MDRLQAKEELKTAGKIRLKLKLAKNVGCKKASPGTVEVDKSATGADLAKAIAGILNAVKEEGAAELKPSSLRLICSGRVLEQEKPLLEQGVRPGWPVMAVRIDANDESLKVLDEQRRYLQSATSDAELLGEDDGAGGGLSVADQSGKSLDLPKEEKKSLIIAMSLHEKGRAALKRKDFDLALVLLLEASQKFQSVRSELLDSVDNFGLLNLDIAWCYVSLGNITQLEDAVARLDKCQKTFEKSYGPNMERLIAVKGSTGKEKALFFRMHLLQAIALYHSGDPKRARAMLRRADKEFKELDIPEDSIEEVKASGYTAREARLALRATSGDVAKAVQFAQGKKEERERIEKEERERRKKRRR